MKQISLRNDTLFIVFIFCCLAAFITIGFLYLGNSNNKAPSYDINEVITRANNVFGSLDKAAVITGDDATSVSEHLTAWLKALKGIESVLQKPGVSDQVLGRFNDYLYNSAVNYRNLLASLNDQLKVVSAKINQIRPAENKTADAKKTGQGNPDKAGAKSDQPKSATPADQVSKQSPPAKGNGEGQAASVPQNAKNEIATLEVEKQYSNLIGDKHLLTQQVTQLKIIITKAEELQAVIDGYNRQRQIDQLTMRFPSIILNWSEFWIEMARYPDGWGGVVQAYNKLSKGNVGSLSDWFWRVLPLIISIIVIVTFRRCYSQFGKLMTRFGATKISHEPIPFAYALCGLSLLIALTPAATMTSQQPLLLLDRLSSFVYSPLAAGGYLLLLIWLVLRPDKPDLALIKLDQAKSIFYLGFWLIAVFISTSFFETMLALSGIASVASSAFFAAIDALLIVAIISAIWKIAPRLEGVKLSLWFKLLLIANLLAALLITVGFVLGRYQLAIYGFICLLILDALVTFLFVTLNPYIQWLEREPPQTPEATTPVVGLKPSSARLIFMLFAGGVKIILALAVIIAALSLSGMVSFYEISRFFYRLADLTLGKTSISPLTISIGIAIFIVGIFAIRATARWLESKVLPFASFDRGIKDSLIKTFRYVGIVVVALLAFSSLGIDLSNIGLIAGALSIGIGFGLQSIINNFVSGLILLAERPIKIGDWIEVSDSSGIVKKIRVRHTEIETFDNASLIVPNANLITDIVKNLTHADKRGRIVIGVGVSYSSNPRQVSDILLECARAHKSVLSYPEPSVLFCDFGSSSLDFDLRCYVNDILAEFPTGSDLRFAIFEAFTKAKIDIPFPQRVITLKNSGDKQYFVRSDFGGFKEDPIK